MDPKQYGLYIMNCLECHAFPVHTFWSNCIYNDIILLIQTKTKEATLGWQWCQQLDLMKQSGHDSWAMFIQGPWADIWRNQTWPFNLW